MVVLSPAYLADHRTEFESVLAQTLDLEEGMYRLLPIEVAAIDEDQLPMRLGALSKLDLTHPGIVERALERLVRALQDPLPLRQDER